MFFGKNMENGWVLIHRKIKDKGWYLDSEYVHLWLHIVFMANHEEKEFLFNGSLHKTKRGEFITGRNQLVKQTGINRSKIERVLTLFEKEGQIEQQKTNKFRLIKVVNYDKYQSVEQQVSNKRATSEQQVSTNKELKQLKELKENMKTHKDYVNEYRERAGKEPMGNKPLSEKQRDFLTRSKLIGIFQQAVNEVHGKTYFTDPDDIADIEKENSKINAQIKVFWIRCKKDLEYSTEVIKYFATSKYAYCDWKPSVCFRKDTVVEYENRKKEGSNILRFSE